MSAWNEGRLRVSKPGIDHTEVFNKELSARLGQKANEARVIYDKFAGKGIWLDILMIFGQAIQVASADSVDVAIKQLNDIWEEVVVAQEIPSRPEMTPLHEEALANSFLIADLAIIRSG